MRILLCAGVTIYHFTPERPASGSFMVLGFFVLSGYLLGRRFFTRNELDVCTFYRDKFIRLVPMFIAAFIFGVFMTGVKAFITGEGGILPTEYEWASFNLATFVSHFNSPCWYIIDLLALMAVAPLFFFFSRYKYGLISAIAAVLLLGIMIHGHLPHYHKGPYYMPLVRSRQFMAGMLAAQLELQYFSGKAACAFPKRPVWHSAVPFSLRQRSPFASPNKMHNYTAGISPCRLISPPLCCLHASFPYCSAAA